MRRIFLFLICGVCFLSLPFQYAYSRGNGGFAQTAGGARAEGANVESLQRDLADISQANPVAVYHVDESTDDDIFFAVLALVVLYGLYMRRNSSKYSLEKADKK